MSQISPGLGYVHDAARKAYEEQTRWIDALDTKAGILMAANGVIVGLVLSPRSVLTEAPKAVAVAIPALLFASLVFSLAAFATRQYEIAPDVSQIAVFMRNLDEANLRRVGLNSFLRALNVNELKVGQKARLLYCASLTLLAGVLVFASFFIYWLF
jgi:hypothetical protein